jgi:putative hemolysin
MNDINGLLILIFIISLILASFFSSAETAFIGTQKLRIRHLSESGNARAKTVVKIIKNPEKFLATVLLGINFFETAMATIGTIIAVSLWGQNLGAALATILLTVITLIIAELVPKSLAARFSENLALAYAIPISLIMKLLFPFVFILDHIGLGATRLFGEVQTKPTISEEEFHTLISIGSQEGTVEKEEAEMLHNIFEFTDRPVREVMIPRPEVIFIEKGTRLGDFLEIYQKHPQSRFPVFETNRDNIVGILSIKDIVIAQAKGILNNEKKIDEVIQPGCFAPETKPIGDLLVEMRDKNYHLCVVVDEYGGTAGVVTMEQLVAEIVGPVGEQLAEVRKEYEVLDEYTFQIDGGMRVDEVNEKMKLDLPEGDYDTVAGFIFHLLGRIPNQGEQLKYKDLKIAITKMTGVKINEVLVTKEKREVGEIAPPLNTSSNQK